MAIFVRCVRNAFVETNNALTTANSNDNGSGSVFSVFCYSDRRTDGQLLGNKHVRLLAFDCLGRCFVILHVYKGKPDFTKLHGFTPLPPTRTKMLKQLFDPGEC